MKGGHKKTCFRNITVHFRIYLLNKFVERKKEILAKWNTPPFNAISLCLAISQGKSSVLKLHY